MDADAAPGLRRGAEFHAAHAALHRHTTAEQRCKAPNVPRQLTNGAHRQIGREIVKKLVHTAPPVLKIGLFSLDCTHLTKNTVPKNGQFSAALVLFFGMWYNVRRKMSREVAAMTDMNTAPQLAPRERCTGCAACCNGCPKGAIRMVPDREGFLYPQVTGGCVQCGHCTHVCPVLKQREPRPEPAAFLVWNGDETVRRDSTAGGAFSALAAYVLEGGGVVFGAALDSALHVSHIAVKNAHDLPRLRGAKPVQSDVGESYQQVRLYLDQGRQVLFSGTPCQVDGLYRYLGEHPERLITCDVACGGVCSPGVWERFVRSMAYVKQQKPLSVSFCGKLSGESRRRFRVTFENGGRYDAPLLHSELGRGISRGLFLRPACHTCGYTSTDRTGDLTLCNMTGDTLAPEEKRLGMSLLLVNSAKGAQVFDSLDLHRRRCDLAEAVAADRALRSPTPVSVDRSRFFDALENEPFRQVCARFLSALQPRETAGKPLKDLLHGIRLPFGKGKNK